MNERRLCKALEMEPVTLGKRKTGHEPGDNYAQMTFSRPNSLAQLGGSGSGGDFIMFIMFIIRHTLLGGSGSGGDFTRFHIH